MQINKSISFEYIPMPKLKTSTVGLFIHRRLSKEEAAKNAMLPRVLKRGSQFLKDRSEIEKYLDNIYGGDLRGGCFKKGEDQIMYFSVESITEKYVPDKEPLFEKMIKLLMSIVFNPLVENGGFSPLYVQQEKKNLIERIQAQKNDKRTYASQRCIEEMCKGTDFAIHSYGTLEDVEKIDAASLYEYYKDMIYNSKIDIFVSGECDEEEAVRLIENALPSGEFGGGEVVLDGILKKDTPVAYTEEVMDVTQGKLSMGFTTGVDSTGDDYYALMVANSIFGGGAHARRSYRVFVFSKHARFADRRQAFYAHFCVRAFRGLSLYAQ